MALHPPRLLRQAAHFGGYALLGLVGTVGFALGLLFFMEPLRPPVFDALYLVVGPWTATETTRILTFTLASLLAVAGATLVAAAVTTPTERLSRLVVGVTGGLGLAVAVLAAGAVVGLTSFLAAVVVVAGFVAGLIWLLRFIGVWPRPAITVGGAIPALVLLLLALGFGLGWGGGYDLVAEEVPASAVEGQPAASFDEAPTVKDDLLTPAGETYAYCETEGDRRTCRLPLRGYEHELAAARFLADHDVRCPYLDAPAREPSGRQSFVATADGTDYRVSCQAYGD